MTQPGLPRPLRRRRSRRICRGLSVDSPSAMLQCAMTRSLLSAFEAVCADPPWIAIASTHPSLNIWRSVDRSRAEAPARALRGAGSRYRIAESVPIRDDASKVLRPGSISYATEPNEKTSGSRVHRVPRFPRLLWQPECSSNSVVHRIPRTRTAA